jgi:photosystem II stability/assembly factor-like uncharacterized protein
MKPWRILMRSGQWFLLVLLTSGSPLPAQSSIWRRELSPTSAHLWNIAATETTAIAVGGDGVILASPDRGSTWLGRDSGTDRWLTGVGFGAGRWLAVGDRGTVLASDDDGLTWRPQVSGTATRLNAVVYGAGRWVAVGEEGTVLTSVDGGVTWRGVRLPGVGFLRALTFGRGLFLLGGQGGALFTTPDGTAFTPVALGSPHNVEAAVITTHGYAVSGSGGLVATASDLSFWTIASGLDATETYRGLAVAADGTVLVAGERSANYGVNSDEGPGFFVTALLSDGTNPIAVGSGGGIARVTVGFGVSIAQTEVGEPSYSAIPIQAVYSEPLTLWARLGGWPTGATYQWFLDELPLPAETNSTLTRPRLRPADAGLYRVRVTLPGGPYEAGREVRVVPAGRPELGEREFQPELTGAPTHLVPLPNGKLLIAAPMVFRSGPDSYYGLARLRADGSVDSGFRPEIALEPPRSIERLVVDESGRIYVAGTLAVAGAPAVTNLVRLHENGSWDPTFTLDPVIKGVRQPIAAPGGGVYVLAWRGQPGDEVVRLRPDGQLDPGFTPSRATGLIGIDAMSRLLVSKPYPTGGYTVVRLLPDGGIDSSYALQPLATYALSVFRPERIVGCDVFGMLGVSNRWGNELRAFHLDESGHDLVGSTAAPVASTLFRHDSYVFRSDGGLWISYDDPQRGEHVLRSYRPDWVREAGHYATLMDGAPARLVGVGQEGELYLSSWYSVERTQGRNQALTRVRPMIGTPGRLTNLSVRARATADAPLIVGFVTLGSGSTQVLVRGIGPALAEYEVPDPMPDPRLRLVQDGRTVGENDQWPAVLAPTFVRAGAFPLAPGSADAALEAELPAGVYTAVITPAPRGASGTVLAELYDLRHTSDDSARFINASARGPVGPNSPLIVGFAISGDVPATVLIRGVGPTLSEYGVLDSLPDTHLTLYRGQAARWENAGWDVKNPTLTDSKAGTGAFALAAGSRDAAMRVTAPPGVYTAVLWAGSSSSLGGTALIEVYEAPPP